MTARAHPSGNAPPEVVSSLHSLWEFAAKANELEGEIASHTRKLEALERRGRALRAEIGRKVEELAHEESRALRDAAAYQEEEEAAEEDGHAHSLREVERAEHLHQILTKQVHDHRIEHIGQEAHMGEVRREEGVKAAIHQVELRKGEVVQI
jgi:serine/threonine-protein kinase